MGQVALEYCLKPVIW